MNQENQASNSVAPEPAKRKRGRPRKDERSGHGAKASSTPKPDTVKRNRQTTSQAPATSNTMLGQVVSGVLDGKFEAGYLLTVRVGDTNTILRGVVFEPGKAVPVSGANDVAPHIAMLRRNDVPVLVPVPVPVLDSQVLVHGSTSQAEQRQRTQVLQRKEDFLPTKVSQPVTQVPKVATQVLPSPLPTKPVASSEVRKDTCNAPQAAAPHALQQAEIKAKTSDIMPRSQPMETGTEKKKPTDVVQVDNSGLPPKIDVNNNKQAPIVTLTPQQAAECESKKEPASVAQTSPSEHNKSVVPEMVLLDTKSPSVSEGPRDVRDASKDIRLETETEPSVELPNKTVDARVSQGSNEAVGSQHNPDMQIDDASKSMEPELNLADAADGSELKHDMQIDDVSKSLEPELNVAAAADGSELKHDMQIDDLSKSLEPELNLQASADGSEVKHDMQIDDRSKSLEPEMDYTTATDGSELKHDMQIDDASKCQEPEHNLTTATDGSGLKPDMQVDDVSKRLDPKFNLATATHGSELKHELQIDDSANCLEPILNLNSATGGSKLNPDMQVDDASEGLKPDLNLKTATDGSERKADMQIDDASKSLELELNLTTTIYGSQVKPDQWAVGELKDKAIEINRTLVATASEAITSQLSTGPITVSQENGTLQKSEQDTESKVPMEIARTDEVTKSEPLLEPRTDQQVEQQMYSSPKPNVSEEEAIPSAQNMLEEKDLAKSNETSKDAPESKTFDINTPTVGENVVSMDAAPLVQTQSSLSESNNNTGTIGRTDKVDLN